MLVPWKFQIKEELRAVVSDFFELLSMAEHFCVAVDLGLRLATLECTDSSSLSILRGVGKIESIAEIICFRPSLNFPTCTNNHERNTG